MVETQVRVSWWRRPWVLPLGFLVVAFVAFSLPRYLTLDRAQSLVPQPGNHAWHYPVLVAHVIFGSIAILTCVLQIWPWFRQEHPLWHRRTGRVYVFAGVLPAGLMAFAIGIVSPFGPSLQVGNVLLSLLWLGTTIAGFRMARQKRFVDHRRWMIRSFALTLSIITNRIWGAVAAVTLSPQLDTTFGGSELALVQTIAGTSAWLGWVLPLLVAEWWLERGDAKKRRSRSRAHVERPKVSV